ncbi:MAG: AAA family ATPase [Ignavibacteria bacterium]|nr:AAA family ATPase [Ignavibacteria bacterium]
MTEKKKVKKLTATKTSIPKMIKQVRLQRFRQFSDLTINFDKFNILVGPNNSGKTTILHAIRSFFSLMNGHVKFEGNPIKAQYHRRYLSGAEEIAPTPDIRELWYEQKTGKPILIDVTFFDGKKFGVSLKQQFGQLHVSADTLPDGLTAKEMSEYFGVEVAFIPGLVGVLVTEPFSAGARRSALANQGRYSEIFRSSLFQLKSREKELIEKINEWLNGLFDVELDTIDFNADKDEFITVKYKQSKISYDVVSSGSGLQQVIQMLTYLYLSKPKVLLIDEPDAHLHSKLQSRLGDLFKKVSSDLNAQVFLSTHSIDLIDTFSTKEVIVINSKIKENNPIGNSDKLVSALVDNNIIDVSALSRLLSSKKLVVIEDKDQTVLKAIDKCCGNLLYSSKSPCYVLPAKGVGNFRAISELGKVLKSLAKIDFEITFVQDKDGMPEFLVSDYLELHKSDGIAVILLENHEIESYLINPELIKAVLEKNSISATIDEIKKVIISSGQEINAEARIRSRKSGQTVNRFLDKKKIKDEELDVKFERWFNSLDLNDIETVVKVFPGKELLELIIKNLNKKYSTKITKGSIVCELSDKYIPPELISLLGDLGKTS